MTDGDDQDRIQELAEQAASDLHRADAEVEGGVYSLSDLRELRATRAAPGQRRECPRCGTMVAKRLDFCEQCGQQLRGSRPREGLSPLMWALILAAVLAVVSALGLSVKHFFETKGPVTLYHRALDFENE